MVKEKVINKPNAIIQAGQTLSATQSKILFSMLGRFKYLAGDEDRMKLASVVYDIPVSEIAPKFLDSRGGKTDKLIQNQTDRLMEQFLTIKNGDTTERFNLVSYSKVVKGGSYIQAKFNLEVVDILRDMIKNGYTPIGFESINSLKGQYSIRVYELLKKAQRDYTVTKNGYYEISLSEFRFLLGIPDKKYPRWQDFKKRVVNPSIEEIVEKTDLRFVFTPGRSGRSISSLIFSDIITAEPTRLKSAEIDHEAPEQATLNFETLESNPLLDGLQPGSRAEFEKNHSLEYIEHYYKKAKAIEAKGRVKTTFENCLYTFLKKDKDDFYNLQKEMLKKENARKLEKKISAQVEKETKEREEMVRARYDRQLEKAIELFDSAPIPVQEKVIVEEREKTPIVSNEFLIKLASERYAKEKGMWDQWK